MPPPGPRRSRHSYWRAGAILTQFAECQPVPQHFEVAEGALEILTNWQCRGQASLVVSRVARRNLRHSSTSLAAREFGARIGVRAGIHRASSWRKYPGSRVAARAVFTHRESFAGGIELRKVPSSDVVGAERSAAVRGRVLGVVM